MVPKLEDSLTRSRYQQLTFYLLLEGALKRAASNPISLILKELDRHYCQQVSLTSCKPLVVTLLLFDRMMVIPLDQ